jgi:hypothetical protein
VDRSGQGRHRDKTFGNSIELQLHQEHLDKILVSGYMQHPPLHNLHGGQSDLCGQIARWHCIRIAIFRSFESHVRRMFVCDVDPNHQSHARKTNKKIRKDA